MKIYLKNWKVIKKNDIQKLYETGKALNKYEVMCQQVIDDIQYTQEVIKKNNKIL